MAAINKELSLSQLRQITGAQILYDFPSVELFKIVIKCNYVIS